MPAFIFPLKLSNTTICFITTRTGVHLLCYLCHRRFQWKNRTKMPLQLHSLGAVVGLVYSFLNLKPGAHSNQPNGPHPNQPCTDSNAHHHPDDHGPSPQQLPIHILAVQVTSLLKKSSFHPTQVGNTTRFAFSCSCPRPLRAIWSTSRNILVSWVLLSLTDTPNIPCICLVFGSSFAGFISFIWYSKPLHPSVHYLWCSHCTHNDVLYRPIDDAQNFW